MMKIAIVIQGDQEKYLLGCVREGKTYSNVLRIALQEYMDRQGIAYPNETDAVADMKNGKKRE